MSALSLILTSIIVIAILWSVVRAWWAFRQLQKLDAQISSLVAASNDPQRKAHLDRDFQAGLQVRGFETSAPSSRQVSAAKYRSLVLAERGKLATYIEVMTTLGLLGTVLGLILAVLQGGVVRMDGIWTALLTTLAGLLAAVACKLLLEVPGDANAVHSLELLANETVVASLPAPAGPAPVTLAAGDRPSDPVRATPAEPAENG